MSLSTGVIGIGGLAKTVVGFLAGIIGTQFIVARPLPRFLVFFAATVLHQTITIGLGVVLGLRPFGSPYAAVAGQALGNAVVGIGGLSAGRAAAGRRRAPADGKIAVAPVEAGSAE